MAGAFNPLGNMWYAGCVSVFRVATREVAAAMGMQLVLLWGSIFLHDVPQVFI